MFPFLVFARLPVVENKTTLKQEHVHNKRTGKKRERGSASACNRREGSRIGGGRRTRVSGFLCPVQQKGRGLSLPLHDDVVDFHGVLRERVLRPREALKCIKREGTSVYVLRSYQERKNERV